jgi:CubicO group peptidase (beta-lactamase class C family)
MKKGAILLVSAAIILSLCSCSYSQEKGDDVVTVLLKLDDIPEKTPLIPTPTPTATLTSVPVPTPTPTPTTPMVQTPTPTPFILPDTAEFEARISGIAGKYGAVGLSLAVFANGGVVYTHNLGYADKELGILTNDNTKYRCASVSKTVTAIIVMSLVEQGLLNLDTPIAEILGINVAADPNFTKNTPRHLLTHTSTMVDTLRTVYAFRQDPLYTLAELLDDDIYRPVEPGERYYYSNIGSSLLAAIIETVTGERFYKAAEDLLLSRLNMDAAYVRDRISDTMSIATLYENDGTIWTVRDWVRTAAFYDRIPLGNQYGMSHCELIISASDLAQFGIILSGDGSVGGVRILNPETVAEMNAPFITKEYDEGFSISYGLGLRIYEDILVEGRTIIGHPGQALGLVAGLYYDPSDGTGLVLISNGCSMQMGYGEVYSISREVTNAVYEVFFD